VTGAVTAGASLTGVIVSLNVSDPTESDPLLAEFRMLIDPVSFCGGVPEKVRLAGLNVSQEGSVDPSAKVAVKVQFQGSHSESP
jgi:hypothetical protein